MDIRPGSNTGGHALHVIGDIKNLSGIIPDSVLVKNDAAPVLWPYYAVAYASTEHDGGTVPDTAYYPKEKVVTVEDVYKRQLKGRKSKRQNNSTMRESTIVIRAFPPPVPAGTDNRQRAP